MALKPRCYFSHEAMRLDTEPDLVLVQGCISRGSASSSRNTEPTLHLISSSWEGVKLIHLPLLCFYFFRSRKLAQEEFRAFCSEAFPRYILTFASFRMREVFISVFFPR